MRLRLLVLVLALLALAVPLRGESRVETWKAPEVLPSDSVNSVHRGADGALWIATAQGLLRRDDRGARVFTRADGLPSDFVDFVWAAQDGAVYAGTDSGLAVLRGETVTVLTAGEEIPGNWFYRGIEAPDGTLWFSVRGHGLLRRDGTGWFRFDPGSGLPTWYVNDLELGPDGTIWIAGYRGIAALHGDGWARYTAEDGLVATESFAVLVDSKDRIWQGSWGNGISMHHGGRWHSWRRSKGLRSGFITDLAEDGQGRIYAATALGGLSVFRNGSWLISQQVPDLRGAFIPHDCIVTDLYVDPTGVLFIATDGHGLVVVHP